MAKLTEKEFLEKYGDTVVRFTDYYKYTFNYRGDLPDGRVLIASYGGNSDDIYRYSVSVDGSPTVTDLEPYAASVYEGSEEVDSFYNV